MPLMDYSINSSHNYHRNMRNNRYDQNNCLGQRPNNRVRNDASFKTSNNNIKNRVHDQLDKSKDLIKNEIKHSSNSRSTSEASIPDSGTKPKSCNVYEDLDWNDDDLSVSAATSNLSTLVENKENVVNTNTDVNKPDAAKKSESPSDGFTHKSETGSHIVIVSGTLKEEPSENNPVQDFVNFSIKFYFCKKCVILMGDDSQLTHHVTLQSHLDSIKS